MKNTKVQVAAKTGSPWKPVASRADGRAKEHKIKRDAVIAAATTEFIKNGFHRTSLEDIAAALHVTKPTLYYYVKSKDEIVLECFAIGLEGVKTAFHTANKESSSARERLQTIISDYVKEMTSDAGRCLIRISDKELSPNVRADVRAHKAQISKLFEEALETNLDAETLAGDDPRLTAFLVAGALNYIGTWYEPDQAYSVEQITARVSEILMYGLLPRDGRELQSAE